MLATVVGPPSRYWASTSLSALKTGPADRAAHGTVRLDRCLGNRLRGSHLGGAGSRYERSDCYDLPANTLAYVRLQILTRDAALLAALEELNTAGKELGSYWRQGHVDDDEYARRWRRHHAVIPEFIEASGEAVRRRLASA